MILRAVSLLSLIAFLGFISGCVTAPQPIEEYTMARTAIDAAKAVESSKYSAGYWHQAEEAYRKAQILFQEREFEESRKEFVKARSAAERAENSARLIRLRNGEVL